MDHNEAYQIGYNTPPGRLKVWIGEPEFEKSYQNGYWKMREELTQ